MKRVLFLTIISILIIACVNDHNRCYIPEINSIGNCECDDKDDTGSCSCGQDSDCNGSEEDNNENGNGDDENNEDSEDNNEDGNEDKENNEGNEDNNKDDNGDEENNEDNEDPFVAPTEEFEYVDLGLSVKWGKANLGESYNRSHQIGGRYSWGGITYSQWINSYKKYNKTDGKTVLEPEDDAATKELGNNWRTPTAEEMRELIDNCTWEWTCIYPYYLYPNGIDHCNEVYSETDSINGYKITGKNGNSIFLPADETVFCRYWTSSLYKTPYGRIIYDCATQLAAIQVIAPELNENWASIELDPADREQRLRIRPVYDDSK